MPRPTRRSAVTIPDVARAAGVSPATAGRALGGYGPVSEPVRERVLAAAKALGYRPNAVARSMITGQTHSLGLVIANVEDPFFARLTRGITDAARAEGFEVLVANTDEDLDLERRAVRIFEDKQVDGILITPTSADEVDHLRAAREQGTSVVLMDRYARGWDVDTVVVDNRRASRRVVRHLLDAGHTRIGLVTGGTPRESTSDPRQASPTRLRLATTATDRIAGYREAFAERGLEPDPRYLRCGGFQREAARDETLGLLAASEPPTAIFATGSLLALGVLEAIREAGRRIPDDISVVSFDDADWWTVVQPPLSVVAQPLHEIGAVATRTLIQRIRGDESPATTHVLDTEFLSRESVAPPRGRRPLSATRQI
jgi:LacI family transcriptional regulator